MLFSITVPVARPVMGDCSNYNGSAIHMQWTPVPDDREHMKGRVMGYKVIVVIGPPHQKTNNLHMRKQRRRSASQ